MLERNMPKANAETTTSRTSLLARLGRRMAGDEEGGTAIEYALIAAGVGAAVAATVYSLGATTAGLYQTIANLL
jgi:Flp pilus assembly pilin Flp